MNWPTNAAESLALLNACLNGTSGVLLVLAVREAKAKRFDAHRRLILTAVGTSAAFLVSYFTRMAIAGELKFPGTGLVRTLYLVLLASHVILAMVALPLILRSVYLGLRMRRAEHRRIVRWAYPIWLYVSVTGVIVYVILYQITWR
ncbi:MAG: DUF420 domain-containing protein [Polyangiales bacterium]|nr:DUF420 domain-containing protein [Myxococcales bacterium]